MSLQRNIPEIIKCIKFLLMKKDSLSNQESISNYDNINSCSGETGDEVKCICHTTQNLNLNSVIKRNLDEFYSQINDSKLNEIIESNRNLLLSDCLCFKKPNNLFPVSSCKNDIIWEYMVVCLKTLVYLNQCLQVEGEEPSEKIQNNEKHCPNIIGVQDQDTVCGLIELVMSFGVLPNLLSGIGRPVKTSNYLQALLPKTSTRPRKILTILKVLLALMKDNVLHTLILSRNGNDIFAALIQLRHCPLKVCDMPITSDCCCIQKDTYRGCINCSNICKHEKKWCENEFNYLLQRTYQPLIIKELLILQRCSMINKKASNKWFLRVIGFKLSKCMMQDNGVKYVIEGILAGYGADSVNWQKYQSIGKLIAHVPSQVSSSEDYYQLVCPQLLRFLEMRSSSKQSSSNMPSSGTQYVLVTVACMQEMLELHFDLAEKYLFNVLLEPLRNCFKPDGTVDIYSVELAKCVSSLQLICNSEVNLSDKFLKILSSVMHPLFVILCLHHNEHFRGFLSSLLVYFLSHLSSTDCIHWFNIFIFGDCHDQSIDQVGYQTVSPTVKFVVPCNQVVLDETKHITLDDVPTDEKISAMLLLLGDKKLENVRGEFFVGLLKQLSESLKKDDKTAATNNGTSSQDLKDIDLKITDIQHKIQLVSVISALIDTFEYTILQNTPQTVDFIKSILDLPWEKNDEGLSFVDGFHEETIDLVLMLISFLLKTDKLTSSDFTILNNLVPSLERAARNHSKESSRALATDLKVYIATRGSVSPDEKTERKPKKPSEVDLSSKEAFEDALKELTDPLLPTRGHALFQLSKLLKHRNKYAMKEHKRLLDIFETNLAHHDTYLYLAAVEGLLFLVDVHHREVLPLLCRKFAQFRDGEKEEKYSSELRMKLGEAIVKSCRLCGDMLPHYTPLLLSALLTGVKDDDHLIRASSLSAIGDVCSLSKFSIGSISTEIVSCIRHVVSTDSAVEVRRAAIQVFSLMFQGIGNRLLQDIPDTLRDIYRLLKSTMIADKDDMTQLHASNALDLLDDVMKEALFAKQPLEKKIQILG